jgi:hypothetical protein
MRIEINTMDGGTEVLLPLGKRVPATAGMGKKVLVCRKKYPPGTACHVKDPDGK